MKAVSLIIARGGSKGIPRKNLMDFCGKPLIVWTIEQSQQCKEIADVYFSTEDAEIADIASYAGAKVIDRPEHLATDTASSDDVILHALEQFDCDVVVHPQATSPLRFSSDFTKALDKFGKNMLSSMYSGCRLEDYCIWDDNFESITYDYLNRGRRQDRPDYYLENGSFYIFKPEGIKEHRNRLHGKIGIHLMNFWQSYEIDSPEDIEVCEYYMNTKILKRKVKYE